MSPRKKFPIVPSIKHHHETEYQHGVLANGLRLVHRQTNGEIAHLALMIGSGTRHEGHLPEGIAHLTEHMLFKGTKTRNARQVVSYLENVGCDINAYTSREETCLHASFLNQHYSRVLQIFAEVVFHSTFPEHELEKEKQVVLDEINSYMDSPAEEIFDRFENDYFGLHPLGRYILGRPESLAVIQRNNLFDYVSNRFFAANMVLVSIGAFSFENLKQMAVRYFGDYDAQSKPTPKNAFSGRLPFYHKLPFESHLSHCLIGMPAYSYNHPEKTPLILLNNILGGPALQSRLNQNIREKYGITYTIESHLAHYSDAGWLAIYMGTDPFQTEKAIALARKEMKKLREQALGSLQLARAKQQLIVQLAISRESRLSEALSVGKAYLMKNSAESVSQIIKMIEAVSSFKLLEIANEIFDESKMCTLIYEGEKQ